VSTKRAGSPGYLTLICQGATRVTHQAAFPDDDPLDPAHMADQLAQLTIHVRRASRTYTSPATSARQTAEALALNARVAPELGDCDFGRWRGQRLKDVEAEDPKGLEVWITDLSATPHGGESLERVGRRAATWLDSQVTEPGHAVAVTNSTVMRWVVVTVLDAPLASFWRVDVEPLSSILLTTNGTRWVLRRLGSI